jgi:hypothetical protein
MSSPRVVVALALALGTACAPTTATLEVQLVTDYAPVRDFDTVTTTIDGTSLTRSSAAAIDRSYGRAVRVAAFDGLQPGRPTVRLTLSLGDRTVQSQPRYADLRAGERSILTVFLSNECEGVSCPGADAPSAIACLGGQCIDPGCSDAHPELCTSTCPASCPTSAFPCVSSACGTEGVCVETTDDTQCMPGEICVADLGCRAPFSSPPDGGVSGDAPPTDLTIEGFAAQVGEHVCSTLSLCLGPNVDDVGVAECGRLFSSAFAAMAVPRLREAEANGTFHYDGSFAAACLASIDISPCEHLIAGYPPVCENALLGRVPIAGGCSDTFECAGDAFCNPDTDGVCPLGTCTARRGIGGACAATTDDSADKECERGLRCVGGACREPVPLGMQCTTTDECEPGAFCIGASPRTCRSITEAYAQTAGQPCDAVAGPFCERPLSCAGTCIAPVAAGAPCVAATPDVCPSGQYCDRGTLVCTTLPTDGAPCLAGAYPLTCAGGLYCAADHLCHDLQPNGASCASPSVCASQRCGGATCIAPPLCEP